MLNTNFPILPLLLQGSAVEVCFTDDNIPTYRALKGPASAHWQAALAWLDNVKHRYTMVMLTDKGDSIRIWTNYGFTGSIDEEGYHAHAC